MLWAIAALAMMQDLPIKTTVPLFQETSEQKSERMGWWREARFGMFIHWGLYSIPAGEWMGSDGHGEWIRDTAHIPLEAYNGFVPQFNPYRFNAKEWVAIAKNAGMKYIVITTKHHDGFALYDSKVSDFDIMSTPFQRDILKELAEECKKEGIVLCFYHSIMDWHHPDYLPRRPWEEANRPVGDAQMDRYVQYMHNQVKELLTNYGRIGIMWFDGEWESTWNHAYGQALYDLCRSLQPNVIVNNRVDIGRGGMGGMSDAGFAGDYGTPEQEIPAKGLPGVDWETCMTMNAHWGFNRHDKSFKSTKVLLQNLVDIASKGGNYLLNVGPDSLGDIPEESTKRLREIGHWMRTNGESIYGTSASLFSGLKWGRSTTKQDSGKTTVYLHVFDWPEDGVLTVPGLGTNPTRARLLGSKELSTKRNGPNLDISVPAKSPDASVSVIALEFSDHPTIYEAPVFEDAPEQFVNPLRIIIRANRGLEVRYTLDGTPPGASSSIAAESAATGFSFIDLPNADRIVVTIQGFDAGRPVTEVARKTFTRATPRRAILAPESLAGGLTAAVYAGGWDRVPDFRSLRPEGVTSLESLGIGRWEARENVGVAFDGYIQVPFTELYIFELTSDDGSKLLIADELVVDNDGLHSSEAKTGFVALEKGIHPFRVEWFNKTGASTLRLRVKQPGSRFADIPADWFRRNP